MRTMFDICRDTHRQLHAALCFAICLLAIGYHSPVGGQDDVWSRLPLGVDPTKVIDLAIEDAWNSHSLKPTDIASDEVFVRRLYLDLTGRIPTQAESQRFVADTNSRKREALVDRLLDSDEHAQHFAELLDAILIGRTDSDQYKRRSESGWIDYLRNSVKGNRSWSDVAKEIILARPTSEKQHGATWYLYARMNKPQDIAEAVSKDLFGVRIDCAQCHDHPLADEIEQRHYWGLVAFFNRSKNADSPKGPQVSESAIGGFSDFSNLQGRSQPNELVYLGNRRAEEARPAKDVKEEDRDDLYHPSTNGLPRVPKFSRREQFAEVVLKDHPLLAQAMVNRMWGWMLGRGIVHPVDSLDSFHPASHPALLDWLGRDFAASGYDVRRLLKSLALTRAYQLSSSEKEFRDPQWFASALPKPLTAESLHRSLLVALDPIEAGQWNSVEHRTELSRLFPDVLTEESLSNVSQGLMLTNGKSINQLCSAEHSLFLKDILSASIDHRTLVMRLFVRILGREPDEDELQHCINFIAKGGVEKRNAAFEGLAWSLVTSSEFRFNH